MKITSYPPMIILLDMLFVFLFILVLNEKKVVDINIPKEKLFDGAKIVYFDSKTQSYYDTDQKVYQFNSIYNLLLDKCDKQPACVEAKERFGDQVYILLPRNLFDEMSQINMLAFGTNSCQRLEFFVKEDGFLDYQKTIKKNSCLSKIYGFRESIKGS